METKKLGGGVSLCIHNTDRFKVSAISLNIICPLDSKTSARALLVNLLARTNKDYPDITAMNRCLASLYGAVISPAVQKVGEAQLLSLSLVSVDNRFALEKENVLVKGLQLLLGCLFMPDITPEGFREENLSREKRLLVEKIESEKDEKRIYALNRLFEEMCADESYAINPLGKKEEVEALTGKDVFEAWKEVLFTCPVQINLTGSFDRKEAEDILIPLFAKLERKAEGIKDIRTEFLTESYGTKTVTEKQKVKQGKLVIGYRAGMTYSFDNYPAISLMTAIFGGGTFSKLFMNVREKMSLCYYCAARLRASKGIITVESGVETENVQKALEAIRAELDQVRAGNFSDETLKNAKLSLKDSYNSVGDSVIGIDSFMKGQCTSDRFRTPEEYAQLIDAVSREEVILAANMISEDTVYILESEADE